MGNPLSPLLPKIFMNNLEDIISKHSLFKKCIYWYVDDILVCFNGTYTQIDTFLQYLNTVHPNIKFTMALESINSIKFLYFMLKKFNNRRKFSIYHKPFHTDITIHSSSCHTYQHKIAAYNSMIYRLIKMCKDDFFKELNFIKQVSVNNGFKTFIVINIKKKSV